MTDTAGAVCVSGLTLGTITLDDAPYTATIQRCGAFTAEIEQATCGLGTPFAAVQPLEEYTYEFTWEFT